MSKYEEANLILKLYDLRREAVLREARSWFVREFRPESMEDIHAVMFSERGASFRMVASYWDMAATLVNHGAIPLDLFNETNGEHWAVFAMLEPFLADIRASYGPLFLANLEKLIDATPEGRKRTAGARERIKAVRARMAKKESGSRD